MKKAQAPKEQEHSSISMRQFRDLAEKSLVGMYLIQDWVFKFVNARFTEIFEYSSEELLNKLGPKDMVIPEDWHIVENNINRRITGQVEFANYEFRGRTKTGRIINIEGYGSRTKHHRRRAIIGTLLDITRRKYAEETLKQAERKYRNIFENAIEGIFQTTPGGQLISANPALAAMLGYDSPEELMTLLTNVRYDLYVDPEKRLEFERILQRNELALSFECQFYKKDRSTIWVSMNARHVHDQNNRTLYYEGTIEDITEKKKAAEQLLILHNFNQTIIDNAPLAIFTVDKGGNVASANPALCSIAGLDQKEKDRLIGFNWLSNPYSRECGITKYLEKGLRGEQFQLWDFPYLTYKGDRKIFIDFKGIPLKGTGTDVERLLCIIEDTSERVRTRLQLMEEAKMSALGRLAAGIAHELSNPLATLVTYTELACHLLHPGHNSTDREDLFEELQSFLLIVEQQAFRCKNLIGDVLSLSRQDGLEKTEIDINQLLEGVLRHREVDRLDIDITKDFYNPLPPVFADSRFLRQAFLNIINNGIDAVQDRINPALWIRTKPIKNNIRIEFEDNGSGIPETVGNKIFEPFFTTKGPQRGVGLGLSLCYEFLHNIGGTIELDSKPGHGTTFLVTIPARQQEREV